MLGIILTGIILTVCLGLLTLFFFISYRIRIKKITTTTNAKIIELDKELDTRLIDEKKEIESLFSLYKMQVDRCLEETNNKSKENLIKINTISEKVKDIFAILDCNKKEVEENIEKVLTKININADELCKIVNEQKNEFDESIKFISTNVKETTDKLEALLEVVKVLAEESKIYKEKIDRYIKIDEAADLLNEEKESAFDVIERCFSELDKKDIKKEEEETYESDDVDILDINEEDDDYDFDDEVDDVLYNNVAETKENIEENEIRTNVANETSNNFVENKKEANDKNILEEKIRRVLDIDQREAYDLIRNTNENIFVTGKAGTGKSFLIDIFSSSIPKNILLLAPTGTAAVNINGATIHSAFGYKNLQNSLEQMKVSLSAEKKEVLQKVDVIIIDEISMVRSDIFDKMDKILKDINKSDEPFGGKQIILFGDIFQLPPVVKYDEKDFIYEKYDSEFFFSSNSFKNGNFKFIELKVNHRQAEDQKFFSILNRIREGKTTEEDINQLNNRMIFNKDEIEFVTKIYAKKENVNNINTMELQRLQGKEYVYQAKILYSSNNKSYSSIESSFPLSSELKLKTGALVMVTKNDPNGRWYNGNRGIVIECSEERIRVKISTTGKKGKSDSQKIFDIGKEIFEEKEACFEDGRIKYKTILKVEQFPLVLAYAMTIHKSQGATYSQIAVDVSNCFAPGQAYVALSRCKSIDGLFLLNPIEKEDIIVNAFVKDFYLGQIEK